MDELSREKRAYKGIDRNATRILTDLKMTSAKNMTDEQTVCFRNREDWLDGTRLITSMIYMPSMAAPFPGSVRSGNNLLLLDLTIAGSTGPISAESLLTQIHAQVLFMIILVRIINPTPPCHGRHGKPELFLPRQIYSIIAYFIQSLRR
jgi:hypothetical protein